MICSILSGRIVEPDRVRNVVAPGLLETAGSSKYVVDFPGNEKVDARDDFNMPRKWPWCEAVLFGHSQNTKFEPIIPLCSDYFARKTPWLGAADDFLQAIRQRLLRPECSSFTAVNYPYCPTKTMQNNRASHIQVKLLTKENT